MLLHVSAAAHVDTASIGLIFNASSTVIYFLHSIIWRGVGPTGESGAQPEFTKYMSSEIGNDGSIPGRRAIRRTAQRATDARCPPSSVLSAPCQPT